MDNNITMSQKEIKKYDIVKKVIDKKLNATEAAELLHLSTRQIRRLKVIVDDKGLAGLAHGNRGKTSNRKIPEKERQTIVKLLKKNYSDFGPVLATEKLDEVHHIKRDKGTIGSIMVTEGLRQPKQKKKEEHRAWRLRKAAKGEMEQYDGSYEFWFEGRGEKCCLLANIDDADSEVDAYFDEHEGVEPTFNYWRGYIEKNGKPNAIYVDRFSTYSMNSKLAKENPDTLTQFERAMTELNIEVIHAHSPQAKGRIERLFKTLQDRLIKELRLQNISDVKTANEFLQKEYLPKFNAKFMVETRSKTNLHQKLKEQEKKNLDSIFSRQYQRVVNNDFTISHKKNYYQLEKIQPVTICKRDKVTVEERMDGSIQFRLRGKHLNYKLLPERPKKLSSLGKKQLWVIPKSTAHIPPVNHPWRQTANLEYLRKMAKTAN